MVIGDVIEGWKDIVRDVRDPAGAEERRREEQLGRFLGTGTEEYAKAVYGREWATHYTTGWQPGGRLWLQREAEAEKEREAKRRAAISDYLDQQAKIAKERAAAEARQEAEARATESRAAALKPLPPERAETWLEAQPKVMQRAGSWMATTPTPQQRLAETRIAKKVAPSLIKIREKGSRALFLLGKSRQTISEGLRPEEKAKRKELEKADKTYSEAVKNYNKEVKQLDKDISRFSAKYLEKPVSQKDTGKAYAIQDKLQSRAISLEDTKYKLEDYEIERNEIIKQHDIKIKAVPKVVKWARSMWVAALSAPIAVAGLGIGLAVKPEETITGIGKGIWGIPGAIKEKPIETITELGVSSVVLGLGFKAIRGAVSKAGVMKVKPKITQSFSVGKSVKVGTRGELNLWKVQGKIITKFKNPKTGKITTFSTKTFTDTITAQTKSGSIKAYSKTLATSLRTGDIRLSLGRTPQFKIKTTLTQAKGELTLNPTDVEKLYRGYGEFGIREIGRMELKYPLTKAPKVKVKVKLRPGEKYEGITDLWVKQLRVTERIDLMKLPKKDIGAIMIGKEYTYSYKALADIYGKAGAKEIMRSTQRGISKAYVPKEGMIFLGAKFKPIKLKAKAPKYKPIPVDMYGKPIKASQQFQQLIIGTPEKAAVKISAETMQKAIGEVLVKKAKPITIPKPITKVTPMTKALQLISPSTAAITRQQLKEEKRLRAAGLLKMGLITKPIQKERQKYIQQVSTALSSAFRTKQIQVSKLTQFPIMAYPSALKIPTAPKPLIFIPGLVLPPYAKKETQAEKKRRKIEDAKIRKQQRAYQASVGAVVLGLRYKRIPKRRKFTGLGLRYMFPKQKRNSRKPKRIKVSLYIKKEKRTTSNYLKRIQNIFK